MHSCIHAFQATPLIAADSATMENAALTLGFSPEGRFQVQARGLFFHANLLEGRFPPWKDDFPEPSQSTAQVSDPKRMLQILRETTRFTNRCSRTTELRLQGPVLKIVAMRSVRSRFRTNGRPPFHRLF